jgi:ferredoxin, 2Fe-2S
MPVIKILPHPDYCPKGAEIKANVGDSICEALLDNGIEIEHACDMSCACTTCHIIVREGFASLNELDENEEPIKLSSLCGAKRPGGGDSKILH